MSLTAPGGGRGGARSGVPWTVGGGCCTTRGPPLVDAPREPRLGHRRTPSEQASGGSRWSGVAPLLPRDDDHVRRRGVRSRAAHGADLNGDGRTEGEALAGGWLLGRDDLVLAGVRV